MLPCVCHDDGDVITRITDVMIEQQLLAVILDIEFNRR
jgi:hypothetical protein